ncbi:GntR family transcriptional regulator [Streptomyces sp. NPDC054765]
MTSAHSNAPSSAPSRVSGGVIHIRTRQTAHFTVLANRLAQRAGSAVTVGVAAYILSLPDGAPITIQALCVHFAEGKTTIAEALRELADEGWLERRVERGPRGRIVTRTFAYDLPGSPPGPVPEPVPETAPAPPEAPHPAPVPDSHPAPVPEPCSARTPASAPEPKPTTPTATPAAPPAAGPAALPAAAPHPQAAHLLTCLHHQDRRLRLSEREIATLAPAVADWLDRGVPPQEVIATLTTGLPAHLSRRPARLLAHRLVALRPPARTAPLPEPGRPPVVPLQNCDGCDRAFRAGHPGRCRDCRTSSEARPAA